MRYFSFCSTCRPKVVVTVIYFCVLSNSTFAAAPVIDGSAGMQRSAMEQKQLADRVNRVERMLKGQGLGDVLNRLELLQREVQQLTGEVEVLSHSLTTMKKKQRELYLDTDRRLSKFEKNASMQRGAAPATMPATTSNASPTNTTTPANVAPTVATLTPARRSSPMSNSGAQIKPNTINPRRTSRNPASLSGQRRPAVQRGSKLERDAYERAFNLLKKGRYPMASASFQAFLEAYPGARYAGNAQYWLGEANYVQRKYSAAIKEFKKVLKKYPRSPKLPDALLKMGYAYNELGQKKQAIKSLETILKKYGSSTAARLAKKRLISIKSSR